MANIQQTQHFITILNEALALDPKGFSKMLLAKHEINQQLAEHPTIQSGIIAQKKEDQRYIRESGIRVDLVTIAEKPSLSALGLINGLLDGYLISAIVNDDDLILEFQASAKEALQAQYDSDSELNAPIEKIHVWELKIGDVFYEEPYHDQYLVVDSQPYADNIKIIAEDINKKLCSFYESPDHPAYAPQIWRHKHNPS